MTELTLKHVTKTYHQKTALCDISLTFTPGIYGLLGPNGAGKSTMMNLICTNLKLSGGMILWNGRDIREWKETYRSVIGFAPQQQALYDSFTGTRFLSYMATLKGISGKEQKVEIKRVLQFVNLEDEADKTIGTYSGGMKQRILIAQALMGNPQIVILDEPTAGLDPKERVNIREKIKQLSEEKIILFSTHVVSDVQSVAKEIILIKSGTIVDADSVEKLCEKYNAKNLEEVYLHVFEESGGETEEKENIYVETDKI